MKKLSLIIAVFAITIIAAGQKRVMQPRSLEERLNEEYCTGLFKTTEGTYFDFTDDRINVTAQGYINILDWLQGRVAGLQIYRTFDQRRVAYIRNQRASLFIDEVPVSDDYMNIISVNDIAMIKIIRAPWIGGWRGAGGAILIYTWRGEEEEE